MRVRGFTYLSVLFVIAMMGGGLALVGELWHSAATRDREAELLFVGNQYRKAIERYYLGGPRQYPRALEQLLKDARKPATERYLRRLYPDPVTGSGEWGLVKAPDGGIMGVHSLSEAAPVKSANFLARDKEFAGAAAYTDWKFVFVPAVPPAPLKPAPPVAPKPAPGRP